MVEFNSDIFINEHEANALALIERDPKRSKILQKTIKGKAAKEYLKKILAKKSKTLRRGQFGKN